MSADVSCAACAWSRRYRSPDVARRAAAAHECSAWTDEQVADFVERSRAAQGLPAKITDPVVLRQVATLLGAPVDARKRRVARQ